MSRSTTLFMVGALGLALAGGGYFLGTSMKGDDQFALLTVSEAKAHSLTDFDALTQEAGSDTEDQATRSFKVTASDGPLIKVAAPSGYALQSPVDFDIKIEPKNGVAVNMKSIRIEYRVGPAWLNVTGRIMKQAKVKGSRLFATGAELPAGKHAMRVTVQDANKRVTKATVSFTVKK
ncbi:MAG: hypothetical protein AB8B51_21770 [Sedimentitalea sp.]